jgi:hypothetical protein
MACFDNVGDGSTYVFHNTYCSLGHGTLTRANLYSAETVSTGSYILDHYARNKDVMWVWEHSEATFKVPWVWEVRHILKRENLSLSLLTLIIETVWKRDNIKWGFHAIDYIQYDFV